MGKNEWMGRDDWELIKYQKELHNGCSVKYPESNAWEEALKHAYKQQKEGN